RFIVAQTRRQNCFFPRRGLRLEPGKLINNGVERLATLALRVGRYTLPLEQEAEIVASRDRLDLGAKPPHGVAVDARKQTTLAPLPLARARREGAGKSEAFDFERRKRGGEPLSGKVKRSGKLRKRRWPLSLEAPARELDQGGVWSPPLISTCRCRDGGLDNSCGKHSLKLAQSFG